MKHNQILLSLPLLLSLLAGCSNAMLPAGEGAPAGAAGSAGTGGSTTGMGGSTCECTNGTPGPVGPIGPKGDKGDKGEPGSPGGATGPQGPAGPAGPQGPQGPAGATGPAGVAGLQGMQGATGLTGPAGAQGPKGDKGDPGAGGIVKTSIYTQTGPIMHGTSTNTFTGTTGCVAAKDILLSGGCELSRTPNIPDVLTASIPLRTTMDFSGWTCKGTAGANNTGGAVQVGTVYAVCLIVP